jgi:glycine/D-amino acid oxidase-like deaminating enzyme
MDEYRRLATIGVSFGIESYIVDPAEMQKLFPLINREVIVGGLYSPGDGVVDPALLCTALRKAAIDGGGKVIVLYVAYLLLGFEIHTRTHKHTHTHTHTQTHTQT